MLGTKNCCYLMPPACRVPIEDAVAVVKQFIDYFCTDTLPAWSDEVWQRMSDTFKSSGFEWNRQCVITHVRENRRNILSLAREQMGIIVQQQDYNNNKFENETEPSDVEEYSKKDTSSESCEPRNKNVSTKFLLLTEQEWIEIKPEDTDEKLKLKPKVWTNIVASAMWFQFRMPCAFIFKRAEVCKSPDESSYLITFLGSCKSKKCNNTLKGHAEKKKIETGVTFAIETRDTREEKHEIVKRPLNGKRRREAFKDLKTEGCAKYRRCEARKLMLPGDIEPSTLPNNNVLRQAKKEGIDKDLGIDKRDGRDIIRSIEDMPLHPQYCGLIHEVAGFPFHVFYASPAQLRVYQEYRRLRKNCSIISLDATGGLVNRLPRKNGTKSGNIFLYAIVINFNGSTACVYQMLSERHDSVSIMTWLFRWIQSGAQTPKEAVCDYSRALLMAISMAFNKQPIKEYIRDRFTAVSSPSDATKTPVTFIRIDVAHFIHMVCRWKSFKNLRQRAIKDFFLRCVTLMVECQTLAKFERVFVLTCAVALQTHEDSLIDLTEVPTPKDARKKLENIISKGNIKDSSMKYDAEKERDTPFRRQFAENASDDDTESEMDVASEQKTSIAEYIDSIITKAQKVLCIGENLNPFYLPDFIDRFAGVAKEFPLWSAVGMPPNTQRATSSYVEEYFRDLKERTLNHYTLPISVDKFMREQAKDIEGTNCIISGKMVQYNNDRLHKNVFELVSEVKVGTKVKIRAIENVENNTVIENVENNIVNSVDVPLVTIEEVNDSDLFAVENWRGKGEILQVNVHQENVNEREIDSDTPADLPNTIDQISPAADHSDLIDVIKMNKCNENKTELYRHMQIDHTYSQLSSSVSNHKELIYTNFESSLNQRADCASTIIEAVEQPPDKQPASTGKYFKAYPEIRQQNALVVNGKSTQLKNTALLPNGSLCPPLIMKGQTYLLRNTCSFDSIVQILATAAIDDVEYRGFLQNSTNSTLKFVFNFITRGVSKNLLIDRARILADFCTPKAQRGIQNNVISYEVNAENNIANTVKHTLSSNPSRCDVEECSVCGKRTIVHTTIAPNHNIISRKGFAALEEALEFRSPIYNIICRGGCLGKFTRTSTLNEHIFIELDIRHQEDLKKSLQCSLGNFPRAMHLGPRNQATSSEYRLAGVIEHLPGHYIAHCSRIGGYWQKFNDMDRKSMISGSKTRIEPHLAIYIRRNNRS